MTLSLAKPNAFSLFAETIVDSLEALDESPIETMTFRDYMNFIWPVMEPDNPFIDGWHIGYMCEIFQAVADGELTRVLLNVPPRHMKSLTATVGWPTYMWTRKPSLEFMFASYASELATKHSVDRRDIIQSPQYRAKFGKRVRLKHGENLKTQFANTAGGSMKASPIGGQLMGFGGDILVVDDPHNATRVESDLEREAVITYFRKGLVTRLNDKKNGPIIVIMQRLHEHDLASHCIEMGYEHFCLPSPAPERTTYVFPLSGKTKTVEAGDPLWPEREDEEVLRRMEIEMGPYDFAAQYGQRPAPLAGGVYKKHWWRRYQEDPSVLIHTAKKIAIFLDAAMKAKQENDYSVFAWWAMTLEGQANLVDLDRDKLEYPDLKTRAKAHWERLKALRRRGLEIEFVVEDKSAGTSLIQDLVREGIPVIDYNPGEPDKTARAKASSGYVKSGVFGIPDAMAIPGAAIWVEPFVEEHGSFPKATHDDQVDTTSMMAHYWYINPPDVEEEQTTLPVLTARARDNRIAKPGRGR